MILTLDEPRPVYPQARSTTITHSEVMSAKSLEEDEPIDEGSQGSNYNNDSLYDPYKIETKPAVAKKNTPEGEEEEKLSEVVKKREIKQKEKQPVDPQLDSKV